MPRIVLEQVQGGNWLADCDKCGTIGVWPTRKSASVARTDHVCGQPPTTPGKVGVTVLFGPPPIGDDLAQIERDYWGEPLYPCGSEHPTLARLGILCNLMDGHDNVACSWERYDEDGEVVESYEWLGLGVGGDHG